MPDILIDVAMAIFHMWNYKLMVKSRPKTKAQFVRHDIIIIIITFIIIIIIITFIIIIIIIICFACSFWAKNLLRSLIKYNLDTVNCKLLQVLPLFIPFCRLLSL